MQGRGGIIPPLLPAKTCLLETAPLLNFRSISLTADPSTVVQVSDGQQSLLARGQLTIDAVDGGPAAQQQAEQPPGGSQQNSGLYPQLYQPPAKVAAPASGEAGIVLSVGSVSWELEPASQALKVRCVPLWSSHRGARSPPPACLALVQCRAIAIGRRRLDLAAAPAASARSRRAGPPCGAA